jgi:hypothetical protein
LTDLAGLLQELEQIRQMLDLPTLLQRLVSSNVGSILGLLNGYLLGTTDVTSPDRLQAFVQVKAITSVEPYTRAAADAALVAITMWSFYRLMWTHAVSNRYAVQLMLPRLLLAGVLINYSGFLIQAAIDVNNVLCDAVRRLGVSWDWSSALDFGGGMNSFGATLIVYTAIFLGYAVLGFAYVVRYALLVVLAVTAPLAALMFVLPETHKYARDWAALFIATLFMQPLQLLVLAIGFMLDSAGNFPIRHLFALATIYIAFKVPGALHSSSTAGSHATSAAKRYAGRAMKALAKA